MTNGEKTALLFGCMFFVFSALGTSTAGIIGNSGSKARTKLANSEKWKYRTEENQKQYDNTIQVRVLGEKEKIGEKIKEYEETHLSNWEKLVESVNSNNIIEAHKYAETAEKQTEEILADVSAMNWGNTGDKKFDEECKALKDKMTEAYTAKYEFAKKLIVFLDDKSSRPKLDDANESLENLNKIWGEYISELSEFIKK
ncbi:hypothetical protein [Sebaldella sp. S0638]|uniref:hypothetical protein n=1 Tax=Sebaldella sp. S0638 TaxID=2957809 RepID=UPI0020A12B4A|nr:hypothetical protein [Sebaldella sp. S0638]MCP1223721.1 hypothetical protein [Sebaldella sp. S0638]